MVDSFWNCTALALHSVKNNVAIYVAYNGFNELRMFNVSGTLEII